MADPVAMRVGHVIETKEYPRMLTKLLTIIVTDRQVALLGLASLVLNRASAAKHKKSKERKVKMLIEFQTCTQCSVMLCL